jgi:dienelactone hydrolase
MPPLAHPPHAPRPAAPRLHRRQPLTLRSPLCAPLRGAVAAALVGAAALAAAQGQRLNPPGELVRIGVPPRSAAAAAPAAQAQHAAGSAMLTQVFKPAGAGPFPVLLYAHGRPGYASQRAQLQQPIAPRHVRYWLARGYAVVAPIRPGYGATGGADQESSGVGYTTKGQCLHQPSPAHTISGALHAQQHALAWVRQQPWAKAQHIVLEGQSVGGLATVALCAANPPGVLGCINFSGGAGGDPVHAPGRVCAPEKITQLMREYGQTTQRPSIWLYAPNDLYWGAEPPRQWHAAFNAAAQGSRRRPSTLVQTPPVGSDGHSLQRAGSAHWGPALAAWLKQNKL